MQHSYLLLVINFVSVHSILGGYNITISEVPYHVNYGDICGAVLIDNKWALTTAHCGNESTYIRIGSSYRLKGPKVRILSHIMHPKYGRKHTFDYDVQLLQLFRRLHFSKTVTAIRISDGECGDEVYLAGWGYLKEKGDYEESLHQVRLPIVPMESCQQETQEWYNHTLTTRMFCAGGSEHDACQGDSGGSAVSLGLLVGLSSFGYGCGRGLPGVYINISESTIREWIYNYTGV